MKKKSTRVYSSKLLSALSHPLRVSIYELIQKGANTTLELEKILMENRVNLYHHLNVLEKVGLIESYFGDDRLKKFRIKEQDVSHKTKIELNIEESEVESNLNESNSLVVTPTAKNKKKFTSKVKEILDISGISMDKSIDIQQVQIIYQHKMVSELKETHLKTLLKKKK